MEPNIRDFLIVKLPKEVVCGVALIASVGLTVICCIGMWAVIVPVGRLGRPRLFARAARHLGQRPNSRR